MKQMLAITRKELNSYFGSPMALIFIGVFLIATHFTFFWIDTFFSRGIADVRPLFRWMPLLMVFLVAALTMRQWSQEEQTGTLEILLTLPVRFIQLVVGKFLAVMALIVLALALTISLPFTVANIGNLDWGPVIGGYLAAILMASTYAALGLFISSRTRNDLVALILTVVIGGILYLIGTRGVTEFVGSDIGAILRSLSTGGRFQSIERGVIDLRDLTYYLSLTVLFLGLNIFSISRKSWSNSRATAGYRFNTATTMSLVALNLLVLNLVLFPLNRARLDLTEQNTYTLSQTTRDLVGNLQEPLLLRAYFSERTHPLLSPLIPTIRDTLREYEIAGNGMVNVEIVDPAENPEMEAEANQTYGIQPTQFQVAGRYESSIVNAYFDILVRYGDQHRVISFNDLIEVESFRDGQVDVRLRSLEYDLTRAINRTVYGFQSIESILAALPEPANLTLYATPDGLPQELAETPETIRTVAQEIGEAAEGDRFTFEEINPTAPDSPVTQQELFDTYNIRPYAASLFGDSTYYLHMVLQVGDEHEVIYPSGDLNEAGIRQSIENALKRFSSGFLQVVGVWRPDIQPDPRMAQFGQTQQPPFSTWDTMFQQLSESYEVRELDLRNGRVPANVDVLLVIAPQQMSDIQRYAIDQFLMRGGSVVVAGSNHHVTAEPMSGMLTLQPIEQGMREMLNHYGVNVEETMVMDPQNEAFPVPVTREAGGTTVQDVQALSYPYFVDVRAGGMADESPLVSGLPAVTLNWAAPVRVDESLTENDAYDVTTLLRSTDQSWTSDSTNIQPDPEQYPEYGFPAGEERASQPLAVSVIGQFESFFAGEEIPTPEPESPQAPGQGQMQGQNQEQEGPTTGTIEQSPASARLVVIGSGQFLNDTVFTISSQLATDRYLNSLQFIQNTVDWSVEDLDLLSIRSTGTASRVLEPLSNSAQTAWEVANYGFALLALLLIALWWYFSRRTEQPMQLVGSPVPAIDPSEQEVTS